MPDENYLDALNLHLLVDLLSKPCLFLLGRPGAGKTAEIRTHFIQEKLPQESVVAFEARDLDGAGAQSIFNSQLWFDALGGSKPIRVVFDSVDEALLGSGTFLEGLRREIGLAKSSAEGKGLALSLVLTSRQEWNESIAGEIAEIWGLRSDDCTYELAPLSTHAALDLAEARGVKNRVAFAEAWSKGDMEGYACWPRTLIWLADEFVRDGKISSSLTRLHEGRCSRQFEDSNREERLTDKLTPERIARWNEAVELLACAGIATGAHRFVVGRSAGAGEFDVAAFANAIAKVPHLEPKFSANIQAFRDALRFGDLFAPSADAWVFQEQSDAEFLAARRLSRLAGEQLADFFGSVTKRGWQVYPQLATTAAMAAIHSVEFRAWLLSNDPLVLIRSDFAALSIGDKESAVDALLNLIDSGDAPDAHEQPSHLQTLSHPNLAAQLRTWLHDNGRKLEAREMAIRIAAACVDERICIELGDDIWQLATGTEADKLSWLPSAIRAIGASWTKDRLMKIVKAEVSPGRHWSSIGAALHALFDPRRAMFPQEEQTKLGDVAAFFTLNPTGVWSGYDGFLRSCHEHLRLEDVDDLTMVLGALCEWNAALDSVSPVEKLALTALKAAANLIPNPRAIAALADWWISAVCRDEQYLPGKHHSYSLIEIGLDSDDKRRALLAEITRHPKAANLSGHQLDDLPCEAIDYPWMLTRLPRCNGTEEKLLARLMAGRINNRKFRTENLEGVRAAFAASETLRSLLPPAPDGDIHATLSNIEDSHQQRWAEKGEIRKQRVKELPRYDAERELTKAIDECVVEGNSQCWPRLLQAAGEPGLGGRRMRPWEAASPEELPFWSKIPESASDRIKAAAREYLINCPPKISVRNESHLGIDATRHALCLLRKNLPDDGALRAAFRPEWIDVALRHLYPTRPPLPDLLKILYSVDAKTTLDCIRSELDFEWNENRFLLAEHLDSIWSAELKAILVELLSRTPIQPESYRSGIAWLRRNDRQAAADLALRRLDELASQPPADSRRIVIGIALLAFPEHWRRVWSFITADADDGLKCIASVASASERLGWQEDIFGDMRPHADFIGALYGWLLKHLPPRPSESCSPTGIDHCRDLERACHAALLNTGCADLLRQAFQFAGVVNRPWTERATRASERNAHARDWHPWALPDFTEWLASDGGVRIADGASLLRAVETSLRRFELSWKEMPPIRLWDTAARTPRREKELSDELKNHLEVDLRSRLIPRQTKYFINREPQFYSNERTDLCIQAVLPDGSQATVVVEVKLCDNVDVATSMETQLARRYLREKNLAHGIYFVGWFGCDAWPNKRNSFQKQSLTKARRALSVQAATLSKSGLNIRSVVIPCPLPKSLCAKKSKLRGRNA